MKTLKKYLGEESDIPKIPEEMQTVIDGIKKNSRPFLNLINNRIDLIFLVSGRQTKKGFIRPIRKNRKSRLLGAKLTKIVDNYFEMKFKERFRSNSVFVRGDNLDLFSLEIVSLFGMPHLIFPIGKFKFLWSPKVEDFNFNVDFDKETVKEVNKVIESKNYTTNNLLKAIGSRNEIMISGNKYYAIRQDTIIKWSNFRTKRFSITWFLEELKNQL